MISKNIIALIRFSDRVGKGIQSAPRDALISSFMTPKAVGLSLVFTR